MQIKEDDYEIVTKFDIKIVEEILFIQLTSFLNFHKIITINDNEGYFEMILPLSIIILAFLTNKA